MTVAPGTCGGSTAAHGTTVRRGGWAPIGCGDYSPIVSLSRRCSRTACGGSAIATLTYVYSDQTAVLGPLATYAEPHTYDLCAAHAERLTAPRGWDVVRLAGEFVDPGPTQDDLLALADAVREAGRPRPGQRGPASAPPESRTVEVGRRGHLRILRDS
jgi:Protein of unknown function (DUF3499)